MAAKRTHELIPFCHPLPLEHCKIDIAAGRAAGCASPARVAVEHRTGVEMEALTGASVAALTIYDMCKALSHDIEHRAGAPAGQDRRQARLQAAAPPVARRTRDERAAATAWCWPAAAARAWAATRRRWNTHGRSAAERALDLLDPLVDALLRVGARRPARRSAARALRRRSSIAAPSEGPAAGIRAAQRAHPQAAWLVLACDLPFLGRGDAAAPDRAARSDARRHCLSQQPRWPARAAVRHLRAARRRALAAFIAGGPQLPAQVPDQSDTLLLDQPDAEALDNVNTPDEYCDAHAAPARPTRRRAARAARAVLRAAARTGRAPRRDRGSTSARTPRELYAELSAAPPLHAGSPSS